MYIGFMPYDTVWSTKKATNQSDIQGSERFSLSNPGHVIRKPSHNGLGQPDCKDHGHFMSVRSWAMSHWQLTTLMETSGHRSPNMGDDSTGTVLSYQLEDAVCQSNTMYNMALIGQLFHPLAESHWQASMEVEEEVSKDHRYRLDNGHFHCRTP